MCIRDSCQPVRNPPVYMEMGQFQRSKRKYGFLTSVYQYLTSDPRPCCMCGSDSNTGRLCIWTSELQGEKPDVLSGTFPDDGAWTDLHYPTVLNGCLLYTAYVGISNYDGETMKRAADILEELHCPFIINQNRYNIFNRTDVYKRQGMSIMGIDQNLQKVVKGLVLLAAVIFDVVSKRKSFIVK